jgi:hypothetical protein
MAGIREVWVNEGGIWRRIQRFYEKRGEQWVELSRDEAVSAIFRHRRRIAAIWFFVAAAAIAAGTANFLLT